MSIWYASLDLGAVRFFSGIFCALLWIVWYLRLPARRMTKAGIWWDDAWVLLSLVSRTQIGLEDAYARIRMEVVVLILNPTAGSVHYLDYPRSLPLRRI